MDEFIQYLRKFPTDSLIYELSKISIAMFNDISIPATLKNPIGRKMYFFLHAITTPEIIGNAIPLSDFLCNKLCVFSSYKRISFHDLIATCSFKQSEMLGTELIIYDKKWYDALKKILDEDYSEIKNVLQKAGITAIGTILSNQKYSISPGLKVLNTMPSQSIRSKNLENISNITFRLFYVHILLSWKRLN